MEMVCTNSCSPLGSVRHTNWPFGSITPEGAEQGSCGGRREYGGLKIDQGKRLKELERENARLKKLLAEAHFDKAMLQEVVSGRLQQCVALNF